MHTHIFELNLRKFNEHFSPPQHLVVKIWKILRDQSVERDRVLAFVSKMKYKYDNKMKENLFVVFMVFQFFLFVFMIFQFCLLFLNKYLQRIVLVFDSINCFQEVILNHPESNTSYQSGERVQ